MNDRIKELAEQAGLSHMPSNYPDMADLYKGADFELEKFAELIVRECTNIMHNSMQNTQQPYDLAYHAMLVQLIAEINELFGIVESKREKFEAAMKDAFKNGVDLSGQETP